MARKSTPVDDNEVLKELQDMEQNETIENPVPERSLPITVGPEKGGNVLAAYRGLHYLFDGNVDRWDVTDDGVVAVNFTVNGKYDPAAILEDISGRTRRVELVDAWPILSGQEPKPFATSLEMTKWMQQYFRKAGEDGKSPEYVKHAIAEYKKAHDFPRRKGRPRKVIRLEEIGKLDETQLAGVNYTELEKLQETIAHAMAAKKVS